MKTSPLVSIIIVNWNGKHWLEDCLLSLAKITYKRTEWIIVDNASTDGTVEWIKKRYPKTRIIINSENLGFSHANNLGYKKAKGEYILFLNNDTKVQPDFIEEFLKPFFKDPSIGGAQSKIKLMDDPTRLDSIGAFLTPTGFLYHNSLGGKDKPELDREIDLYTVKGACMMFRADVLKKVEIGGWIFDPSYFAYFEETDLCHRIWLAGYRIVYAPKSVIFHKMGATSTKLISSWVQYNSYKNRINSYIKNLNIINFFIFIPLHLFLCNVLAFAFVLKGNILWALAIERAIVWNIFNIFKTIKMRKYIQNHIRKQPDYKFFSIIMVKPGLRYFINIFWLVS